MARLESWRYSASQSGFERLVVALGVARILVGLWAFAWQWSSLHLDTDAVLYILLLQTVVYSLLGLFLYRRGGDDTRARLFGCVFILIASSYVHSAILRVAQSGPPPMAMNVLALAAGLRAEVFLPFFFWLAVELFPESTSSPRLRKVIAAGTLLSLAAGGWYFLLGLSRILFRFVPFAIPPPIQRVTSTYYSFWDVLFPLLFLALPPLLLKFRQLRRVDRRRGALFFFAATFLLGIPFAVIWIATWFPLLLNSAILGVNNLVLSTFPFVMTYTVLAQRLLDLPTIARSALRHMFAKYFVSLLGFLPFGFLVYFAWLNRRSTIEELFSGSQAVVLVLASLLGMIAILYRRALLDFIDRRFFSESYNSRRVLTELVEQVRGTRNIGELAKLVERGVDLALHLQKVSLLIENPAQGRFLDPAQQVRPLDVGSPLITLVSGSREPIAVDLDSPKSPFLALPAEDKSWLAENGVEMIAPACALDGSLIGLLALGGKRSELPFLREDRELLAGVASSAGLVIELLRLKETLPPAGHSPAPATPAEGAAAAAGDKSALECIACDRLYPPGTGECPNCHVDLEKTNVPYIFRDLYRFDFRLGAGGMAVVYRAKDLKLGRPVAIKTLPKVTAEAAMRLRREARTAASVSHPGLAAIYGLETWHSVPMIITELLAGGTLADQLGKNPLAPLEAVDMARTVALALAKLHAVGILHRDVKPSNIGFTEDGDVKLLDFGIARIQHDFRQEKPDAETALGPDGRSRIINTASVMLPRTRTGQLVGTVTYLSPEAARGEKPDPSVDLWALAVCVYESLTAENLFYGRNFDDVLGQIRDLKIPDVRRKAPACPESLALFLGQELDLDRSRRAEDGREMASRLAAVRSRILAA